MPSFSSSSVLDAAGRAAAGLTCLVTRDRRPRVAAPELSAENGGEDVLAAVSTTARAGGSGPALLAAGGDAGTSAAPAAGACAGACAGGIRGVEVKVERVKRASLPPPPARLRQSRASRRRPSPPVKTKYPSGERPPPARRHQLASMRATESDSFTSVPHLSTVKKSLSSTLKGCSGQRRQRFRARLQHTRRLDVLRLVTLGGLCATGARLVATGTRVFCVLVRVACRAAAGRGAG